jgi:hypothetical protein
LFSNSEVITKVNGCYIDLKGVFALDMANSFSLRLGHRKHRLVSAPRETVIDKYVALEFSLYHI